MYRHNLLSTIKVIKFDPHIFFQGMCKTKNRRTCTWIHWYVKETVPALVLILIIIFLFGKSFLLVGRPSVVQVHVYPFYYDHWSHGDMYVSKTNYSLPLFCIRWSIFLLIIVPNVELSPMCSPQFRPGIPGEQARVLSQFMLEVMKKYDLVEILTSRPKYF